MDTKEKDTIKTVYEPTKVKRQSTGLFFPPYIIVGVPLQTRPAI